MNYKEYHKDDLNKKYAIICWSAEDYCPYTLISLHDNLDKANKRLKFLKRQAKELFDKGIDTVGYMLVDITDDRIKQCNNYSEEDDGE